MFKGGHTFVGIGVAGFLSAFEPTLMGKALVAVGAMAGTSAPDWLEISHAVKVRGKWVRKSVIPHRTITHWVPPWIALAVWAYVSDINLLWGFAVAALMHLATDIPNPSGIPVISPFKNTSLYWWKSGENDVVLSMIALGLAVTAHALSPYGMV